MPVGRPPLLEQLPQRRFSFGGMEAVRACRAFVGDPTVAVDDVEAVRRRGVGRFNGIVHGVDERREFQGEREHTTSPQLRGRRASGG
jgi:hypothetical protein